MRVKNPRRLKRPKKNKTANKRKKAPIRGLFAFFERLFIP